MHFFKHQKSRNTWDQTYCLRHMEKKLANFTQWGLAAFPDSWPSCPHFCPKLSSQDWLLCSKIGLLQAPHQMYISCTSVRWRYAHKICSPIFLVSSNVISFPPDIYPKSLKNIKKAELQEWKARTKHLRARIGSKLVQLGLWRLCCFFFIHFSCCFVLFSYQLRVIETSEAPASSSSSHRQ